MAITSKNRSDLKGYFVKNAIPTEQNFADLVDAQLNQADDGVFKIGDDPLSVVAAPGVQKRVLRFYSTYPAQNPDWTVSLEPRANATDPNTAASGFGLDSPDGNNRLFLDANGKLGLGTTTPDARLTVSGGDLHIQGGSARKLKIISDQSSAGLEIAVREPGTPYINFSQGLADSKFGVRLSALDNDKLSLTSGVTTTPMLGIGLAPQEALHVKGNAKLTGSLTSASVSTPRITVTGDSNLGNLVTSGSEVRHSARIQANGGIDFSGGNLDEHIDKDGALYRYGGSIWLTVDDYLYIRDRTTEKDAKAFTFDTNKGMLSLAGDLAAGGKVYSGGVEVLPLRIVSGVETTTQENLHSAGGERTKIWTVNYSAFTTAPTISVALAQLDTHRDRNLRVRCYAQNVTATSAQIVLYTWGDTLIYRADVSWIAHGT